MQKLPTLLIIAMLAINSGIYTQHPEPLDPSPPDTPVKLIFIHHSTGGNWLADPSENELGGELGKALMDNHYYVSATNYGWGINSIGDATDIPNWLDWFSGERSEQYLKDLYSENGQNIGDFGSWPRLADDPGGENEIILFKSCFPNSDLEGRPDDPPAQEGWLSVSNAKYVYNEILKYFATRPDKLFIVITAPPLTSSRHSKNARAFNLWLVNDWLRENSYAQANVAVFDFYNVLTGTDHHHRLVNGLVEHTYSSGHNTLAYPSEDDHPSREGNLKATEEFISLLNAWYNRWKSSFPADNFLVTSVTQISTNPLTVETDAPVISQVTENTRTPTSDPNETGTESQKQPAFCQTALILPLTVLIGFWWVTHKNRKDSTESSKNL